MAVGSLSSRFDWPESMRRCGRRRGQSGWEATRRAEERSGRVHINKLHFTHFSPHPARHLKSTSKALTWNTCQLITHTHTQTNTLSHALSVSPFLLALKLINSLTTFFLMVHLATAVLPKLLCLRFLRSQRKCPLCSSVFTLPSKLAVCNFSPIAWVSGL